MSTDTVLTDAQIQQAVQCLVAEATISGDSVVLKNVNGCIRAIEQAVLQSPEVQRLREDAARWRKLLALASTYAEFKDDNTTSYTWAVMRRDRMLRRVLVCSGQDLVAAIDEAMEQKS